MRYDGKKKSPVQRRACVCNMKACKKKGCDKGLDTRKIRANERMRDQLLDAR